MTKQGLNWILLITGIVIFFIVCGILSNRNLEAEHKRSQHWMGEEKISEHIMRYENAEAVCYVHYNTRISCIKK